MMSGAELFTEHTATAVYPVPDRRASSLQMIRLWILVAAGNLLGVLLSGALLAAADAAIGARTGYVEIGRELVALSTGALFASSILAGALMAMGAWLILSTPPTVSQLASIHVATLIIGVGGLHHSIASSVEAFTALLMSDEIGAGSVARFVGLALLGNLIGGSVLVTVMNYAHIRRGRETEDQ